MLRKAMTIIVLATAVALGGTALSTAALARGGGFSGGHFGGGHVGGSYGGRFGGQNLDKLAPERRAALVTRLAEVLGIAP
jgi:Spy/CpxP family protein refolding chaperone